MLKSHLREYLKAVQDAMWDEVQCCCAGGTAAEQKAVILWSESWLHSNLWQNKQGCIEIHSTN